jgi:hypothetical protein
MLTKLDVSHRSLGMEGALVVSHYLKDNQVLRSLDLSDNKLGSGPFRLSSDIVSSSEQKVLDVSIASWGPSPAEVLPTNTPLGLIIASPPLADADITNVSEVRGKIAVVNRGGNTFGKCKPRRHSAPPETLPSPPK